MIRLQHPEDLLNTRRLNLPNLKLVSAVLRMDDCHQLSFGCPDLRQIPVNPRSQGRVRWLFSDILAMVENRFLLDARSLKPCL